MPRAHRVDANQSEVVSALRAVGAFVFDCSRLGGGFPDLFVHFQGYTCLIECKSRGGRLTGPERAFITACPAPVHIVFCPDDALRVIGAQGEGTAR